MNDDSLIRFESVSVTYPGATRPTLRDVDLTIGEGELVLVVGRTGSGKSTLLKCVNGLVPHFTGGLLAGRVMVDGRDTRTSPPRELADVVGMVGQDPQAGFVAEIVEDELAYGMECLGIPPDTMRRRVEETLDLLGLSDLRQRSLATLSGGQRQRVAIGASLTCHPRVLVLDEPTSALDVSVQQQVLSLLAQLQRRYGLSYVFISHDLAVVRAMSHRVIVMRQGEMVEEGEAEQLFSAPRQPYTQELLAAARLA